MIKIVFCLLVLFSCTNAPLKKPSHNNNDFRMAWVKNLDPNYKSGNLPIGTSSPFIYQDILYMGNLKGEMIAYDLETGREVWKHTENFAIQSPANIFNNHVYYGSKSGRLFARHFITGKLKYSIDLGAPIESKPIFYKKRAFLHLRNHTIVCLDAETGKIFWLYQRSVPFTTTLQKVSLVLPHKNNIIVGFADGNLAALRLEEGTIAWEEKISTGLKFIDVDVSPVSFANHIVAGSASGPIRFLNPSNGAIEKTVEFVQSHTPMVTKEGMYVGSVFGEVALIDQYGKIIKRKKISDDGISSIVKFQKNLIVSTFGGEVFKLKFKDFNKVSTFHLGHEQSAVFGEMVVYEDYLSFYSSRNRLYVVKSDAK